MTFTKQLEQLEAERLAAVGQTVAGLAHGVKNLLMGIEGGMRTSVWNGSMPNGYSKAGRCSRKTSIGLPRL